MSIMGKHQQQHIRWQVGDLPLVIGPFVCAIGNFDGVHLGHQHVLRSMADDAERRGMTSGVITFSPHPRQHFRPDEPAFLLMAEDEKIQALFSLGITTVITVGFTEALQQMSAADFVSDVLVTSLNVSHLFAGSDFCFGKNRQGDMAFLAEAGQKLGMTTQPIDLLKAPDSEGLAPDVPVSSSQIRAALREGRPQDAEKMLGRPHMICGIVAHGDRRGRTLSFPTANLVMEDVLHPAFGVYAVTARLQDGRCIPAVANIGRRPTVNDRGVLCEVHLFEFDEEIYDQKLCVMLHHFLRGERKFSSLDELTVQISQDVADAKALMVQIDAGSDAP